MFTVGAAGLSDPEVLYAVAAARQVANFRPGEVLLGPFAAGTALAENDGRQDGWPPVHLPFFCLTPGPPFLWGQDAMLQSK